MTSEELKAAVIAAAEQAFGWRDGRLARERARALEWTCGVALASQYVIIPLTLWLGGVFHYPIAKPPIAIDDSLWQLMLGMLGMAGLRTIEKRIGTTR